MEIVKRLEGSEPEEIDYDFEEHYLQEDEEDTKRKKSTLWTMIGLIIVILLGYFGVKSFSKKETKPLEKTSIVAHSVPKKIIEMNQSISSKKIKKAENNIIEPQKINKIITYTEVLAKKIQPIEVVEKKKELPPSPKLKDKVIKKTKPIIALQTAKTITIKKGDTLARLAQEYYGSSKEFKRIIQENKSIESHKTHLKIGQKIVLPSINKSYEKQKVSTEKTRIIEIKKGDTLVSLAQKFYGNSMKFQRIIHANKNIKSSKSRLKLGQKVIVPYLPKSERRRFVTVRKGYSLAYISKKFYGNINEIDRIVKANSNIKNKKSTLRIGQKVYVPR